MTRISKAKDTPAIQPDNTDIFATITRSIKSGDFQKLLPGLQSLAALKLPEDAQQMSDRLLPMAIDQINQVIAERFCQNKHRTNGEINRIWKTIQPKRENYSTVVSSIYTHLERHGIQISEDLAVQCHLPLLVGPDKFSRPLGNKIKILDSTLGFTQPFIDFEKHIHRL